MNKNLFYGLMVSVLTMVSLSADESTQKKVKASSQEMAQKQAINNVEKNLEDRAKNLERYFNNQFKADKGVLAKKGVSEESLVAARDLASDAVTKFRESARLITSGLRPDINISDNN